MYCADLDYLGKLELGLSGCSATVLLCRDKDSQSALYYWLINTSRPHLLAKKGYRGSF